MIQSTTKHLFSSNKIDQSLRFDLTKNLDLFSFTTQIPSKKDLIDLIFKKTVSNTKDEPSSASSLLHSNELGEEDLDLFNKLGFNQLSKYPQEGIILEHPTLPGWLIKKNYGSRKEDDYVLQNLKAVAATRSNFHFWMLPPSLRNTPSDSLIEIKLPNSLINPLRVVMLKRGQQWIDRLQLTHLKAVKEYLYVLPGVDPTEPLDRRVVVVSQKENLLDISASLHRYAELAIKNPKKLKQIASQMTLFIRNLKLTDSHLNNFPFLNDQTDTVVAVDGEPIGGLADTSLPKMVQAIEAFDPSFYSLLGLKRLQTSISIQMKEKNIPIDSIKKVQQIFDEAIHSSITSVIRERIWTIMSEQILRCFSKILNTISFIFKSIYTETTSSFGF